jgi:hypothetical protein
MMGASLRAILRTLLGAAVIAAASVTAASCVGLHQLDGYNNAISQLCAKLTECFDDSYYPACAPNSETRLGAAGAAERANWLTQYADSNCLENCTNARSCIDRSPVCAMQGSGCGQKEECCGFTKGKGDCTGSSCCTPDGVACGDSSQCCQSDCIDGLCGGFACLESGAACSAGEECCTLICEPSTGTCADQTCFPPDSQCSDNFQCCTGFCSGAGADISGVCAEPICAPVGDDCQTAEDCCQDYCVLIPRTGQSVCSDAPCVPNGILCNKADECCSGFCNPDDGRCGLADDCLPVGSVGCEDTRCCVPLKCAGTTNNGDPSCCSPEAAKCDNNSDCCSGDCTIDFTCSCDGGQPGDGCSTSSPDACCSGACGTDGVCCEVPGCTHDVCIPGPPLDPTCACSSCPVDPNAPPCIAAICATPGFEKCCCHGWDQSCVDQVQQICNVVCVITELPPGGNQ